MPKINYSADYRLRLRARILNTAVSSFRQRGIKAVKMDDIANSLSISKRTLYEIFHKKEDLLYECVKVYHESFMKRLREAIDNGKNVIEIIAEIYKFQMKESSLSSPVFYEELSKYPQVDAYLKKNYEERKLKSVDFLRKGVKEGIFRPDINFDIVNRIANANTEYVMRSKLYNLYPLYVIFWNAQLLLVRGMCTEKGLKILDEQLGGIER
ncbi:MAG: TetR/AcrR family transcriptional regulator [Prevotella sp.]|nr:TetR/AcrR family transcriptional regulator [Prevotella sp.]